MVSELTRPVDPEFATNYELGFKFEYENQRFRFNPTIYYTEYEDAQRAVNIITLSATARSSRRRCSTTQRGEAQGVELEFQALVTDAFRVRAQASYLDAKYDEFVIDQPGLIDPVSGAKILPSSATSRDCRCRVRRSTAARSRARTRLVSATARDRRHGEVYYEDKNLYYISAAGRISTRTSTRRRCSICRVTYTRDSERYFIRAYGKNLTDERYRIASQSVATLWTHTQWGPPENYGVEVGFNFGGGH